MPRELSKDGVRYWRSATFPRWLSPAERRAHTRSARRISRRAVRAAKSTVPVRTGRLRRSIRGATTMRDRAATMRLSMHTPYAAFFESGYPALRTRGFLRRIFRRFFRPWQETIQTGIDPSGF